MPIKTNLTESCTPALGGFTLLAAEGPDAEAFLQAQLMNDVRALSPRQWQWNGWLNAKGRVQALFALIRLAPDAFWLVLPDFAAIEKLLLQVGVTQVVPADTLKDVLDQIRDQDFSLLCNVLLIFRQFAGIPCFQVDFTDIGQQFSSVTARPDTA